MGSAYFKVTAILLLSYASQFTLVHCDGDHSHAHSASTNTVTSESSGPSGTVTTVHTSSGDPGAGDGIAGLISAAGPRSAAAAAASQHGQELSGSVPIGAAGGAYNYPPPPGGAGIPGLGGLGALGGLPFGFGPYKSLSFSGGYDLASPYLVFKKIILVIGGGILILVILAILAKSSAKGGLLYGFGSSISEALAGSASIDLGPFHKSVAGSAAVGASAGNQFNRPGPYINPQLNQRVQDSLDQQF
ncbi:Structural polyprotein [Orchesella cincta]|uniref:Structural polyprotein n=1 Tax=Orchesella cincta TaxID=48709 RepID=A0A1D2N061_ORCCI|nr:Structural polyprotein [Orchesella cincta]